jgi:hypothetical protein
MWSEEKVTALVSLVLLILTAFKGWIPQIFSLFGM